MEQDWTARRADGYTVYRYSESQGPLTCLELPLPASAPPDLLITTKEPSNQTLSTHDPILDEWVSVASKEPERARALLLREGATEAVMSLIKGHAGEVRDGAIRVEIQGFVLKPAEVWESVEQMADILAG